MVTIDEVEARFTAPDPGMLRHLGLDQFPLCPDIRVLRGRDG
jgi:hypothetical protein